MMTETEKRITYIKTHKSESASKIITNWKGTNLSIRKKEGLKLIRETRNIKPKTNRKKYIPTKYKITPTTKQKEGQPKIELPQYPEKSGYYVAKIEIKKGVDKGKKYFIAYQDKKNYIDQRDKIINSYGHKPSDMKITFHGFHAYKPFIDPSFDLSVVNA